MPVLTIHRDGQTETVAFEGTPTVREVLAAGGVPFEHPCGGRGTCGQCGIAITGRLSAMTPREKEAGQRLSCLTRLNGDAELKLESKPDIIILKDRTASSHPSTSPADVFAAADLGTTTIVLSLYRGNDPLPFFSAGAENPQRGVADDVLGRISYAREHGGERLQRDAQDTLAKLARSSGEAERITQWTITGNTTMLYLLTGRNPEALGKAPFEPDHRFDETIPFLGRAAYLPPCIHGFIGADLACAVLASGMCDRAETALLCDLGTNGELALWKNGVLYATSVAMGPALEGVGIRNGCGARPGAIDRVSASGNGITVRIIGGEKATGLCGSGVIDAVACGLGLKLIGTDGRMEEPMALAEGVRLYQEDVQSVLLAKAALNAGMEILMNASGTAWKDIWKAYLCGGFGSRMNLVNAAGIGLIPAAFPAIAEEIGNAAIRGAAMLRDDNSKKRIREIASRAKPVLLGGDPAFNRLFTEHLHF